MNAPLVSVLIPVRNGETVVAETLNSVFRQSHSNLQVVVVDNGSTDRTVEVVRECFADAPYDCTLAECAEPGANRARNVAYELARGDFAQWLDAGDQIHEEKKERQLAAFAKNDDAGIAVGDWIWRVQLRGTNRQGTVDLMQRLSLSAPWGEPKWRKQGSFAERRFVQPHHHDFLLRLLVDTRGLGPLSAGPLAGGSPGPAMGGQQVGRCSRRSLPSCQSAPGAGREQGGVCRRRTCAIAEEGLQQSACSRGAAQGPVRALRG